MQFAQFGQGVHAVGEAASNAPATLDRFAVLVGGGKGGTTPRKSDLIRRQRQALAKALLGGRLERLGRSG